MFSDNKCFVVDINEDVKETVVRIRNIKDINDEYEHNYKIAEAICEAFREKYDK